MRHLLFLFFLSALCVCSLNAAPPAADAAPLNQVSVKVKGPAGKSYRCKANSLGERLEELAKDRNFHCRIKIPSAGVQKIKEYLAKNPKVLENARSLGKYKELGFLEEYPGFTTELGYLNSLRAACSFLAGAAFVQAAEGNITGAVKDLGTAVRVLRILLRDARCRIDILSCLNISELLKDVIQASALPPADKRKCLRRIPKRKSFSTACAKMLDRERMHFLYIKETKDYKNSDIKKWGDLSDGEYEFFQKIPSAHLDGLLQKGGKYLTEQLAARKIDSKTRCSVGTAQEDILIHKLLLPREFLQISNTLAGKKKQKK